MRNLVIAIDGPAASGKTTTARAIARRLGYLHIDTGAMYRAMTVKVFDHHIDLNNSKAIASLAGGTQIELKKAGDSLHVFLDGTDVSDRIRTREVTNAVSAVSAIQEVRDVMVREQRRMGKTGGVVLEGRDIGTVVFPDADVKIYMIADIGERALRRQREMVEQDSFVDLDELRIELAKRDAWDSGRNISPLRQAKDAILLDTSKLTIDEQVEFVVQRVNEKLDNERNDR
ncbi:MAG TPA: (d)CMP kinase [Bacteroidota bacterium]|nr:(d)CMP kinase [Bacteroidota bacterium]